MRSLVPGLHKQCPEFLRHKVRVCVCVCVCSGASVGVVCGLWCVSMRGVCMFVRGDVPLVSNLHK